ncbi:hypothetical protein HFN_1124 [Helicobacter fennelliae MRY12-0050]|uniref:Uncharacterized protein n=1 Tax=Helicobacter fennelliae MRY12-0050 TaxID=1325130 RepID=T1CSS3_9HELI|nr:hypothetical protein HFN_1124 [Helicobacter fennelliae MRY12-0050]
MLNPQNLESKNYHFCMLPFLSASKKSRKNNTEFIFVIASKFIKICVAIHKKP